MSWLASVATAILIAAVALFGAGTVASLAVDWYNISSFEGGAGFFVVGMSLFGGIGGFVIGLVVSRVEARKPRPRFVRALGTSGAVVAAILAVIAGASWMLADIPPQIDGEELFLQVEIRWPASGAPAPNALDGAPYVRLGALSGSVARKMESGSVFVEDARQEDGRWIVPGALPIFTSRGGRLLEFGAGDKSIAGFMVPLPRYPGDEQRQWSGWLPLARPDGAAQPHPYTYRFKVIRRSEAVRTQKLGSFEIDTVARYFYHVSDADRLAANATFRLRYNGQPVPEVSEGQTVAVVGGNARTVLFVTAGESGSTVPCALLIDEGSSVRVQPVSGCTMAATPRPLTSDRARFLAARRYEPLPGWIDRVWFATPGLYRVDRSVLDTRTLTAVEFSFPSDSRPDSSIPPLDLSPDERSFVWLVQGSDDTPRLGVTEWQASKSYILPIDRARMRYHDDSSFDPDWVRHHFEWRRGEGGAEVLAERSTFTPLPYRGDLSLGKPGEIQSYRLRPGGEPLGAAIVDILVKELGGERLHEEAGVYGQRVRVNGKVVGVAVIGTPTYVYVSMEGSDSDPQAMSAIAAKLDAALATGRYDALFVSS